MSWVTGSSYQTSATGYDWMIAVTAQLRKHQCDLERLAALFLLNGATVGLEIGAALDYT